MLNFHKCVNHYVLEAGTGNKKHTFPNGAGERAIYSLFPSTGFQIPICRYS